LERPHIFIGPQGTHCAETEEQETEKKSFHHLEIGCRPAKGWRSEGRHQSILVRISTDCCKTAPENDAPDDLSESPPALTS
jgi:hypothetical protein